MAFDDRNPKIDEAQFPVVRVAEKLQLCFAHLRRDISLVPVVRLDLFLVAVKLGLLVGARPAK